MLLKLSSCLFIAGLGLLVSSSQVEAPNPMAEKEQVRHQLEEAYAAWSKARENLDRGTFDRMLAEDFWGEVGTQKFGKKEFMDEISQKNDKAKLVRFETQILTVQKKENGWSAVITEKLESEVTMPDGKKVRAYSFWVTRDGWRKEASGWVATSTEGIGWEGWRDKKPPIKGW